MTYDSIKTFLSDNAVLIIGAGVTLIALAAVGHHCRRRRLRSGAGSAAGKPAADDTAKTPVLSTETINDILADFAAAFKEKAGDRYGIRFAQSLKQGYRGYYVIGGDNAVMFMVCRSKAFEGAHGISPFWIELPEDATARFTERTLKRGYDIYPHPEENGRILVAVPVELAGNAGNLADAVLDLALKLDPGEGPSG